MHVGSVVIDCNDLPRMLAFWQEALHYRPRDPLGDPAQEDFVVLKDPEGRRVNVSLQKVPEPRVGKNRLHLDLYTDDEQGEVERLLRIGASRHPRQPQTEESFTLMVDPEGNVFCVVDKRGAGPAGELPQP